MVGTTIKRVSWDVTVVLWRASQSGWMRGRDTVWEALWFSQWTGLFSSPSLLIGWDGRMLSRTVAARKRGRTWPGRDWGASWQSEINQPMPNSIFLYGSSAFPRLILTHLLQMLCWIFNTVEATFESIPLKWQRINWKKCSLCPYLCNEHKQV